MKQSSVQHPPVIVAAAIAGGSQHHIEGGHAVLPGIHIAPALHEQLQQVPTAQQHMADLVGQLQTDNLQPPEV